jgi:hypothetical protein
VPAVHQPQPRAGHAPRQQRHGNVHAELLQARKLLAARQLASCEPPLQHCAKLYHWVETSSGTRVVRQYDGAWFSFTGERTAVDVATRKGWRYVAPCEEPPQ